MKKLIASIAAAALLLPAAVQARDYNQDNRDRPEAQQTVKAKPKAQATAKKATPKPRTAQQSSKNWKKGDRFDRNQATNYRVVDYRNYRSLKAPPRGYRWVQSGNDAVLIGITSGVVSSVVSGLFR